MAKSSNQKMKVLYIAAALLEQSDEDHPMTAADLISYLAANGINAERKAIYDDIENLRLFGLSIENRRKAPSGFYISKRLFSEEELRLLSDAVQCAPFMPEKAADSILAKIIRQVPHASVNAALTYYSAGRTGTPGRLPAHPAVIVFLIVSLVLLIIVLVLAFRIRKLKKPAEKTSRA